MRTYKIKLTLTALAFISILTIYTCKSGGGSKGITSIGNGINNTGIVISPDQPQNVTTDVSGNVISSNKVIVRFNAGVEQSTIDSIIASVNGAITGVIPQIGFYEIEVPTTTSGEIEAIIAQLLSNPNVKSAEKEFLGELDAGETDIELNTGFSPDWNIWGFNTIQAPQAFAYLRTQGLYNQSTPQNVVVAVLDSGFDISHLDLNENFIGFPYAYDFADKDSDVRGNDADTSNIDYFNTIFYHGTHVSGIIAAESNGQNTLGSFTINGIAYRSKILPLKVMPSNIGLWSTVKYIFGFKLSAAVTYAVDFGVDVINLSLNNKHSEDLKAAIDYANSKGVVVVASAGNKEIDASNHYPSAYPNVISVGATRQAETVSARATGWPNPKPGSNFSSLNQQSILSLGAPGDNIWSLMAENPSLFEVESGTSQAAPFVSGLAALLKALDPTLNSPQNPSQIEQIMRDTADNIPVDYDGDTVTDGTWKRINAYNAVLAVTGGSITINSPTNLSASLYYSNVVKLTWIDNSLNEDGFIVERKESTASTFIQIANISMRDIVTFYDLSATPLKNYDYRIYAYNASGNSGFSNVISISTPGGIMYQEDFTVDPLWTTNYPTRIYWNSLQENFYSNFYYRNDQSWQYGFSDYIVSTKDLLIEWDSLFTGDLYGATFGFVYSDGQNPPGYIDGVYYWNAGLICGTGWGNSLCIELNFGNRSYVGCQCSAIASLAYGQWVHNKLKYDSINQNFLYVATLLSSGQQIQTISTNSEAICNFWSWSLAAPTCPYLGFGVNGSNTKTSLFRSYLRVDNINLYYPSTFK